MDTPKINFKELVRKMLKCGFTPEHIATITGKDIQRVIAIVKEQEV